MIYHGLVPGVFRVGILLSCAFLSLLFTGCRPEIQGPEGHDRLSEEQEKRELVTQLLGEFECKSSVLGQQNIGFSMILDCGWPAIEVLHANLNNKTPAIGTPNAVLDNSCLRPITIGELCNWLLHEIIKPKNLRHQYSWSEDADWDAWIKSHRGMTIEEIRRQWLEDSCPVRVSP